MTEDPIVADIRRFRNEHAEKYGHDLKRICNSLREFEKSWLPNKKQTGTDYWA